MHLQRLTCLWPGLPKLWYAGDRVGLGMAVVFSLAANGLLIVSFSGAGVTERSHVSMFGSWLGWSWVLFLAVWIGCVVTQARQSALAANAVEPWHPQEDAKRASLAALFQDAQVAYLGRNWVSAETLVRSLLHEQSRDVESRLLLVSILRETQRFDEALRELKWIEETDGSGFWIQEVRRERQRIETWREESQDEELPNDAKRHVEQPESDRELGNSESSGERSPIIGSASDSAATHEVHTQQEVADSSDPPRPSRDRYGESRGNDTHQLTCDSSNGDESTLSNHSEDEPSRDSPPEFGGRSSSQAA